MYIFILLIVKTIDTNFSPLLTGSSRTSHDVDANTTSRRGSETPSVPGLVDYPDV